MKNAHLKVSGPTSRPNLLEMVLLRFAWWYQNLTFRLACNLYERRIAYFELEGFNLDSFLFTGSLRVAHDNICNLCKRNNLPSVPFHSFVTMLKSGKPVRFQSSGRWVSIVAYLHK